MIATLQAEGSIIGNTTDDQIDELATRTVDDMLAANASGHLDHDALVIDPVPVASVTRSVAIRYAINEITMLRDGLRAMASVAP